MSEKGRTNLILKIIKVGCVVKSHVIKPSLNLFNSPQGHFIARSAFRFAIHLNAFPTGAKSSLPFYLWRYDAVKSCFKSSRRITKRLFSFCSHICIHSIISGEWILAISLLLLRNFFFLLFYFLHLKLIAKHKAQNYHRSVVKTFFPFLSYFDVLFIGLVCSDFVLLL